jgi:hypothetical protein
MTFLYPWLSHNSLRQAYHAFDMDSPGDMPTRPILQVIKIGSSSVTMGRKKVATLKYPPSLFVPVLFLEVLICRLQCTDGGMGQNSGIS